MPDPTPAHKCLIIEGRKAGQPNTVSTINGLKVTNPHFAKEVVKAATGSPHAYMPMTTRVVRDMGADQRLLSDRETKLYSEPMELVTITSRIPTPAYDRGFLRRICGPVIDTAVAWSEYFREQLGLALLPRSCVLASTLPVETRYCPHLLTSVLTETSSETSPDLAAANARVKINRVTGLPLSAEERTVVVEGTVAAVKAVKQGFQVEQACRRLQLM